MISIVALIIVGCDHTVNSLQDASASECEQQAICDSVQDECIKEEPVTSLDELIAPLEDHYSDSTNFYFDYLEMECFEENKCSPIDSCTIEIMHNIPESTVIKLTKKGSAIYYENPFADSTATRMAAIVPPSLTWTLLNYIDKVYFSRTAGKLRSYKKMRESWSCDPVIIINIYGQGRHIEDRYFGKSVLGEGNMYDYSYEVASMIDLIERIIYDFRLKTNDINGLLPLRDFHKIK